MISMRIEMVPAYVGKIYNVRFRYGSLMRCKCIAYCEFLEIFSEWMFLIFIRLSLRLVNVGDLGERCRATLNSYPLHIVFNATDTSHFFSASRPARTAVHKQWKRRAVTGTFFCAISI